MLVFLIRVLDEPAVTLMLLDVPLPAASNACATIVYVTFFLPGTLQTQV